MAYFQKISHISLPGIYMYKRWICCQAITLSMSHMFRHIHMISSLQKIINHLFIFRRCFCKAMTDYNHAFRLLCQVALYMNFPHYPRVFSMQMILCTRNVPLLTVRCKIWFYFIIHFIQIFILMYYFHYMYSCCFFIILLLSAFHHSIHTCIIIFTGAC